MYATRMLPSLQQRTGPSPRDEVASRIEKHALLEKLNMKSHTELVDLGNNIIKPIVDGLGKFTERTITFYDGLKTAYKPSKYVEDSRMQWIQSNETLHKIANSKSMFRFYDCRITKQFPRQFNFLVLTSQLEFYQNKIVNQS